MSIEDLDQDMHDELPGEQPPERPVIPKLSFGQWARENLFNNWYNSLITVVFGALIVVGLYYGLRFLFVTGRWSIIRVNLTSIMTGLFPRGELWRTWAALYAVTIGSGFTVGSARVLVEEEDPDSTVEDAQQVGWRGTLARLWPILSFLVVILVFSQSPMTALWLMLLVLSAFLAYQAGAHLPHRYARFTGLYALIGVIIPFVLLIGFGGVGWDRWGGLLLTLFLAVAGIVLSFPIGVAAALARRSSFPAMRIVAVGYIEFIRGVPLITLLFMAQLMLQFFFPPNLIPGLVVRAIIMLTLFTGAYVAEIVRGGLQSVPRGQYEAAQAVGLSPLKQTRLIILPQALRSVIPALVGQFISLFKDTSLVVVIGMTDLLRVLRFQLPAQGQFQGQGLFAETLVFAAFVYWVFAYTMSRESQRLEQRLGVGER